jgi:putative ABC transport system permease protein
MNQPIGIWGVAAGFILLIIPFTILLWYRTGLARPAAIGILRMTVQLLFVGLYLQVVFQINNPFLTLLWLLAMVAVADGSILNRCDLRFSVLGIELYLAMLAGTLVPLAGFVGINLLNPNLLEARFAIPVGGMILGNCLRSNVVGIRGFYHSIRQQEKQYQYQLALGASRAEAARPYLVDALNQAFSPTIAMLATTGLVSLPGMMTGVILAGENPFEAILYQIAIMVAIFTGTSLTVLLGIKLTMRKAFTEYGGLDGRIFKIKKINPQTA